MAHSLQLLTLLLLASARFGLAKLRAQPRTLVFPPTTPTRIQFIGGIGIPVEDLNFESVTSGYVLKAEYFLPTEAQQLRPTYYNPINIAGRNFEETLLSPLTAQNTTTRHMDATQRREAGNTTSSHFGDNFQSQQYRNAPVYRWIIYRGVEMLLTRAGLPGRTCMLRSICEHAAVPLHYQSGMLAEILHILLTPSTSYDDCVRSTDEAYLQAEILGRSGGDCAREFSKCTKSPLDQISTVFVMDE